MNENTLTAADIAQVLKVLSAEVASAAYKRRNPGASDEEAAAWGLKHRFQFVCEALDVLVSISLADAEQDYRQDQQGV